MEKHYLTSKELTDYMNISIKFIEKYRHTGRMDQEAPHLSAVIRLAFEVPCRKSELSALVREHLDLINQVIL